MYVHGVGAGSDVRQVQNTSVYVHSVGAGSDVRQV